MASAHSPPLPVTSFLDLEHILVKPVSKNRQVLFVLVDENSDTQQDAEFGNPPVDSPVFPPNEWWDMPSDRHGQGANLSFVDGHVEHWKWQVPKVFIEWVQPVPPQEMPDFQRVQNAMKQLTDD